MLSRIACVFLVCIFLMSGSALAQATYVLDTGDPNERACNPRSYTNLGNGIVRDNVTGLEWQKETAPGTGFGSYPDTYRWQEALSYCESLVLGGHDDWRLPTIEELSSLVDSGRHNPSIDPLFSDTMAAGYYSSTLGSQVGTIQNARGVVFDNGRTTFFGTSGSNHVRAVRGEPYGFSNSFVVNGDGTVTDTATGLMWQHETAAGVDSRLGAVSYCNNLELGGHSDWRLPTRNELQSLFDYSLRDPATAFPNTVSDYYWSSTREAEYNHTYCGHFGLGTISIATIAGYVRAVRGGLCRPNWNDCADDSECDDGVVCNGVEVCVGSACTVSTPSTCEADEYCDTGIDACVECLSNTHCSDDGLFCNGPVICSDGVCAAGAEPCLAGEYCNETADECVECMQDSHCSDDSLFCTGVPICETGVCGFAEGLCEGATSVCDEANDRCVECLDDSDCPEPGFCLNSVCEEPCELKVKHKEIRFTKLTKPRKVTLEITGEEDFDIFGHIELGPLIWQQVSFNTKKNRLKIKALVPAGLAPGSIPVSVGDCSGAVEITGPEDNELEYYEFSGRVLSSSDDGMEQENTGEVILCDGSSTLSMLDLDLGRDDDTYRSIVMVKKKWRWVTCASTEAVLSAMRFTNVSVPQESGNVPVRIKNAYIEFTARTTDNVGVFDNAALTLKITAQAADNPVTLGTANYNISSRTNTTASVTWDIPYGAWSPGLTYSTPDLSALVQEIVSRPGWNAGQAIIFKIDWVSGNSGRVVYSFDGNQNVAPRLVIEYGLFVD